MVSSPLLSLPPPPSPASPPARVISPEPGACRHGVDGCGWPRGGVGRKRGLAFYLKLPPSPPPPAGSMWGDLGGVCGQSFSVPLSDGRGRVFAPPKAGFAPAVFALLPLCPRVSAAPRVWGSRVLRPRGRPPREPGTGPASPRPGCRGWGGWWCRQPRWAGAGGAGPVPLPRFLSLSSSFE